MFRFDTTDKPLSVEDESRLEKGGPSMKHESIFIEGSSMPLQCQHHWVIEDPDGRISKGRCRLCGSEKEFKNLLVDCVIFGDEGYPMTPSFDESGLGILSQVERSFRGATVRETMTPLRKRDLVAI